MKVAVVLNQAPFVQGGAELLAGWLANALEERGHQADVIRIPFRWHPPQKVLEHILAARLIRLDEADRVVAMKFPAYYVQHPSKVLWLLHQFRQAYDLWGTPYAELPDTPSGRRIRHAVVDADGAYLPEAQTIYTNSRTTSQRLLTHNGIGSEVLYPPLPDPDAYRCDSYRDYVFYPARISGLKRQRLLVEAMAHVRSRVRLVLAGAPDEPGQLRRLQRRIDELGLGERIDLRGHWIAEEEKRHLFAHALASAYVAYDEDSYGYSTLESFHARKAVITCTDSGGTHELVEDGVTGLIAEPTPQALAQAMDTLMDDRDRAISLGQAAHRRLDELDISWDAVVRKLLA
jgi:glycosyltransferase involved in cell wall biosynthesis